MNKRTNKRNQHVGKGVLDTILKKFTAEKYTGERHGYVLNPDSPNFMKGMNFLGPGTNFKARTDENLNPLPSSIPLNKLDQEAYKHDKAYYLAGDAFKNDPSKKQEIMKNVWNADKQFITNMKKSEIAKDDPMMAKIAGTMINAKMNLEQKGLMDTKRFTGFGKRKHPASKLLQIAEQKLKQQKNKKSKVNILTMPAKRITKKRVMRKSAPSKKQKGGFIFPLLSALAAPLLSEGVKKLMGGKRRCKKRV